MTNLTERMKKYVAEKSYDNAPAMLEDLKATMRALEVAKRYMGHLPHCAKIAGNYASECTCGYNDALDTVNILGANIRAASHENAD